MSRDPSREYLGDANLRAIRLRVKLDFLAESARMVIGRWDTPLWKNVEHTGIVIDRLRAALATTEEKP